MTSPEDLVRIVHLQHSKEQLTKQLEEMVKVVKRCSTKEKYVLWQEVLNQKATESENLLDQLSNGTKV